MTAPTDLAGLTAWYRADSITGIANGGALTAWADSSGNGYLTEQPFNDQPTFQTAVIGPMAAVRFGTGGGTALRSGAPISGGAQTIFAVVHPTALGSEMAIRGSDEGGLTLELDSSGHPQLVKRAQAWVAGGSGTLPTTAASIVTATYAADAAALYVNGTQSGSVTNPPTVTAGTYTYIGAGTLFGDQGFVGDIAEVIVYNRTLTTSERGQIHSYLQDKYGIAVSDYVSGNLPPTVPTGLTASAATGQVALTWSAATDDKAVTGYRIYRRSTLVGTTAGTTYTDYGLPGGIRCDYRVTAVDADGGESDPSTPAYATTPEQLKPGAPTVIWEDDFTSDIDGVGAIDVLHTFADKGEVKILGMMSSSLDGAPPAAMDAYNTFYGRPDIPIGARPGFFGFGGSYPGNLAAAFPHSIAGAQDCPTAVNLYRQLLSAAPDRSVTLIVSGFSQNLQALLSSTADGYSALAGNDLVVAKVKELFWMGGVYPSGNEFNFTGGGDQGAATYQVVNSWPTPVTYLGFEVGGGILTGGSIPTTPSLASSPIAAVYANVTSDGWASSDAATVYAAIRPDAGPFTYHSTGRNTATSDGNNAWTETSTPPARQRYVITTADDQAALSTAIDALMMTPAATVAASSPANLRRMFNRGGTAAGPKRWINRNGTAAAIG